MHKVIITGTGSYAPGTPISNTELRELTGIQFNEEKIATKIGIKNRHIAHLRGIDETTADFSSKAAQKAIENAGLEPDDIDLFIVGTDTPEYITPATAIIVQGRLQKAERNSGAFDIASSCASFANAFDTGATLVANDPEVKHAVIVGAYNMPAFFRPGDSFGYSIFADGAGAIVLSKVDSAVKETGYICGHKLTDGTQWNYIGVYTGGTKQPATVERLQKEEWGLQLLQRLPGDRNVKLWPTFTEELVRKAGITLDDIDYYIYTQINASVIKEVMNIMAQPEEKAIMIMDKYGYTGSGCIPMAFDEAIKQGRIKKGDIICTVASGAGLAVSGNIFQY